MPGNATVGQLAGQEGNHGARKASGSS